MKISRPLLRYYGGKWRLASRIVQLFPPHHIYTEVFGGAGSVLLHKPRSAGEIYNDLDGEVLNVFRVLQVPCHAKRLEQLLRATPFSREEFEKSYRPAKDQVERARRTIIRSFMGFGSDSITRVKAASAGFNSVVLKNTMRTGFRFHGWRSNVSAAMDWSHYPDAISAFTERLHGVCLENRDAIKVLEKCDAVDALHYVDPPYPSSVRNNGATEKRVEHNYRHELTDKQHARLSEVLHSLQGMVVISSYPGKLYDCLYRDWERLSWTGSQFCHGAAKRTECVWLNPAAIRGQTQMRFAYFQKGRSRA